MELLTVSVSVITIVFTLAWLIKKRFSVWKEMGVTYEEPVIPYGNLKGVGTIEHMSERMQKIYRKHKGKSPFVGIYVFFRPAVLPLDLDLLKSILIKDSNNFNDRGIYYNEKDDPISAHMFNLHGKKWRLLRTKLSPTFTSGKMKMMFPKLLEVGKRLEVQLDKFNREDREFDVKILMARFTVEVIGNVAFGIECNSLVDENSEFHRMGLSIFTNPRHHPGVDLLLGSFRELALKFGIKRFRDDVSEFFTKVVSSTVDYRAANNVKRNDFMDLLIGLKQIDDNDSDNDKLSLNEVVAQAFVFFVAGFETSSSVLQFCFYELAAHPEIQDRARNHINEVLARHNGDLTYEAMMDMSYIDQVINETLRLYPPLANLFRTAENDYQVPDTSFMFKKGTLIIIPAFAIQRDPEIYPNPDEFNPENFSEENMKNRPSVAFLPFGEGPRNCIGARFGMMQTRIAVITALKKFSYTLSPRVKKPIKITPGNMFTNAEGGIWLKVDAIKK